MSGPQQAPGPGDAGPVDRGSATGSESGEGRSSAASALERSYRWLLGWYPREHRDRHGEEMLAVLLAGAEGRSLPSLAEATDLLVGAARLRARALARAVGSTPWSDAWAVLSLVGPVLLLAGAASGLHEIAWFVRHGGPTLDWIYSFPDAPGWLLWPVVAILGLAGRRRTAAAAAWLAAGLLTVLLTVPAARGNWTYPHMGQPGWATCWILLAVLTAVAATVSSGARGLAVLGWHRYLIIVAAVTAVIGTALPGHQFADLNRVASWLLVLAAALACRGSTRTGRQVMLLLLLPGLGYLAWLTFQLRPDQAGPVSPTTTGLVALAATTAIAAGLLIRALRGRQPKATDQDGRPPA